MNTAGVIKAMEMPPGTIPSQSELEKRDQRMAKAVVNAVGLEPEKYRLGYTKVTDECQYVKRFRCITRHFLEM